MYDLALVKLAPSGGPFVVGDGVPFTVWVKNQGDVTANEFTLRDFVPAGMSLAVTDPVQDWVEVSPGVVELTDSVALASGESRSYEIVLTLDDDALGTYVNGAEVAIDDGDDVDSQPGDFEVDPIVDWTDVAGLDVDDPADEDDSDIAILVLNQPSPTTTTTAVGVTSTTIASATSTTTAAPTTTTVAGDTTTTTALPTTTTVAGGTTTTTALPTTTTAVGATTTSVVGGTTTTVAPTTTSVVGGTTTTVAPTSTTSGVPVYDLALVKLAPSGGPFVVGDGVPFTVWVKNQGDVTANEFTLRDFVPAGMSLAVTDPVQDWVEVSPGVVELTDSVALASGESRSYEIVLTLDDDALGTYVNGAEVAIDDGDDVDSQPGDFEVDPIVDWTDVAGLDVDDPADEDDSDIAILVLNQPSPTTTTTALGATTTTAAAGTTTTSEPIPSTTTSTVPGATTTTVPGATTTTAAPTTSTSEPIPSTTTSTVAQGSTTTQPGATTTTVAGVTTTTGVNPETTTTAVPTSTTTAVPVYDLALVKLSPTDGPFVEGDVVSYTILVKNQGDITANEFTLRDDLPVGMSLVATQPVQAWVEVSPGVLELVDTTPLDAGDVRSYDVVVSLDDATLGSYVNGAEIAADDGDDIDSQPGDIDDDPVIERTDPSDIDTDLPGDEDDSDIAVISVTPPSVTSTTQPIVTSTTEAGATTTTAVPTTSTTSNPATTTTTEPDVTTTTTSPAVTTTTLQPTVEPGSIGDTVFNDVDGDGLQDQDEAGVPGITVVLEQIVDGQRVEMATTVTDEYGRYVFDSLAPGEYCLKFYVPSGMSPSPADQGGDDVVDSDGVADGTVTIDGVTYTVVKTGLTEIVAGENDTTWDQGLVTDKNIVGDKVWSDLDGDGYQDANEPGVPGVTVVLEKVVDGERLEVATTTTDANGNYLFDDVDDGEYCIKFLIDSEFSLAPADAGSDDTADSDGAAEGTVTVDGVTYTVAKTELFALAGGQIDLTLDQGIVPPAKPASLGDLVWNDADQDGIQDDGEDGIAGITVNLYQTVDGTPVKLASSVTDENGMYSFGDLPAGDYWVEFLVPTFYNVAPADQGSDDAMDSDGIAGDETVVDGMTLVMVKTPIVTLHPGDQDLSLDLGLSTDTASLGDYVWVDSNDNGIQDAGESGIAGIEVRLLKVDEDGERTLAATMTTDDKGLYLFDGLEAGNYVVQFVVPGGYQPSSADSGSDDSIDSDGIVESTIDQDGVTYSVLASPVIVLEVGEQDITIDQGVVPTVDDVADLALTKTAGPVADGSMDWTFKVINNGPAVAKAPIVVTDQLPVALTYTSAEVPQGWACSAEDQIVKCVSDDDLAVGETITFAVTTEVDAPAGSRIVNSAAVAGANAEKSMDNNASSAATEIPESGKETNETAEPATDLTIAKSASAAAQAGVANWEIVVTNVSDVAADAVQVKDQLPSTLTYSSVEGDGWTCSPDGQTVLCDFDQQLQPGDSATLVMGTAVDAPAGTIITNTAIVSTETLERDLSNNQDDAQISTSSAAANNNPVAFTGANSMRLAMAALLLTLGGVLFVMARRRITPTNR